MKTYEQLMKHYWGIIVPMAEAAGINPWECVRHVNEDKFTDHPKFEGKPWNYIFALTVLEGKPVFVGDSIYYKEDGSNHIVGEGGILVDGRWTWTPPTKKRTFILGDKELPCPVYQSDNIVKIIIDTEKECVTSYFGFETHEDAQKVYLSVLNPLATARDKE